MKTRDRFRSSWVMVAFLLIAASFLVTEHSPLRLLGGGFVLRTIATPP